MNGMPNPMQMMAQTLQQMTNKFANDPMFQRAQQMAKGKTPEECAKIAKNLCAQRGINFDDAMAQFNYLMSKGFK